MALVQQVNIAAVSTIVLQALHFLSCWGYVFLMKANFVCWGKGNGISSDTNSFKLKNTNS